MAQNLEKSLIEQRNKFYAAKQKKLVEQKNERILYLKFLELKLERMVENDNVARMVDPSALKAIRLCMRLIFEELEADKELFYVPKLQ